ncbi:MAG: hypothetical protein WDZ80_07430 [Candidatus Paceibacterota bacterium]
MKTIFFLIANFILLSLAFFMSHEENKIEKVNLYDMIEIEETVITPSQLWVKSFDSTDTFWIQRGDTLQFDYKIGKMVKAKVIGCYLNENCSKGKTLSISLDRFQKMNNLYYKTQNRIDRCCFNW